MDEFFELPLAEGEIAATCVCTCTPGKLSHFPANWCVNLSQNHFFTYDPLHWATRQPQNCTYTTLSYPSCLSFNQKLNYEGPRAHRLFNSGLVILKPSDTEFEQIKAFLDTSPVVRNFTFGDQDVLGEVFNGRWTPLPFIYNALRTLRYVAVVSLNSLDHRSNPKSQGGPY